MPQYQQLNRNGSWNPRGTGIFRILDCSITGGFLEGRALSKPSEDAVIGLTLQNADDRAPAPGLPPRPLRVLPAHRRQAPGRKTVMRYDHGRENLEMNAVNVLAYDEE